jgi:hypothetical protein
MSTPFVPSHRTWPLHCEHDTVKPDLRAKTWRFWPIFAAAKVLRHKSSEPQKTAVLGPQAAQGREAAAMKIPATIGVDAIL